jgi:2-dehydro-3-deoxy-L-rhamnonate dehydrogenase (NAD+)
VMAMTKTVAKDTAALGIMVTAITPAAAETAMAREISQARRDEITSKIPMGRFVEIDEIARMVMWLSSDDCSFSTGGIFDLSGGRATY